MDQRGQGIELAECEPVRARSKRWWPYPRYLDCNAYAALLPPYCPWRDREDGDEIIPTVGYTGNYNYHMTITGFTRGTSCGESYQFSTMGTPNYVRCIMEDTGLDKSCNPPPPSSSSTLFSNLDSPANGAPLENYWSSTTNPHGNVVVSVQESYNSNPPGCYDSERIGEEYVC